MKQRRYLVTTEWLSRNLNNTNLRIFDVSVRLFRNTNKPGYRVESGFEEWKRGHIPRSGFLDLIDIFSDRLSSLPFTKLDNISFLKQISAAGVSLNSTVVFYSSTSVMWATRFWWMMRSVGFENVAVLDGGLKKWLSEGRQISLKACAYKHERLSIKSDRKFWIGKEEIQTLGGRSDTRIINTLAPDVFAGQRNQYGRCGHIPFSKNLYYKDLTETCTLLFKSLSDLKKILESRKLLEASAIVIYCGSGISATVLGFVLHLFGHTNVRIYDGSMSEWVLDNDLPLHALEAQ